MLQKEFKRKANENDSRKPREGKKDKETVKGFDLPFHLQGWRFQSSSAGQGRGLQVS